MAKRKPSLLWVYHDSLTASLDKSTWLDTTMELQKLGWEVTLATVDIPPEGQSAGLRFTILPHPRVYLLGYFIFHLALLRFIISRPKEWDIVLFHQYSAPFLIPLAPLRRFLRCRIPRIVMDTRTLPMNSAHKRFRRQVALFGSMHRLANALADGQTAITARMAEAVGIPRRQLLGTWPSGVRAACFAPAMALRQWPGADHEPLHFVYIGGLWPERGLTALCQAVAAVHAQGLRITLSLVGEGSQRAELRALSERVSPGLINVCPPIPHAEVPQLLATAHIGVLPFPDELKFRVSSPIKLFEYLAAGMPILATRVVCHTDVLGTHDCVFWADDASPTALAAALEAADRRRQELKEMGERAMVVAASWTWQQAACKLDQAIRRTLV